MRRRRRKPSGALSWERRASSVAATVSDRIMRREVRGRNSRTHSVSTAAPARGYGRCCMSIEGAAEVLHGRRGEREMLDRLLDVVRGGQSRVLVMSGEPGVG